MFEMIKERRRARRAAREAHRIFRATEHLEPYLMRDAGLHRDPVTQTAYPMR